MGRGCVSGMHPRPPLSWVQRCFNPLPPSARLVGRQGPAEGREDAGRACREQSTHGQGYRGAGGAHPNLAQRPPRPLPPDAPVPTRAVQGYPVRVTALAAAVLTPARAVGPPGPTAAPSPRPVFSPPPARAAAAPSRRPGHEPAAPSRRPGHGPASGGGATAYLPSPVLGTIRGRDLSAQRIDRVADNAARLLVQGNRDTIPGPRPPVPSTTEPQHQQHECQGPHRLAPVRLRHLRRLLGSPHADLLRLLDGLSTNLRSLLRRLAAQLCGLRRRVSTDLPRLVLVTVLGANVALQRIPLSPRSPELSLISTGSTTGSPRGSLGSRPAGPPAGRLRGTHRYVRSFTTL